jgi:drug/metabolite transporter (DMT)-like permease
MNLTKSGEATRVRLGLLIATIGGLLFTLDLPLLRLAEADRWTTVWARGVCLFISMSLLWLVARKAGGSKTPYIAGAAGIAVVLTATVGNIAYIGAIFQTSAANVVFVTALIPILTALLSHIFIGEKVHGVTWLATIISFAGVAIIVSDGIGNGRLGGDILALVAALCSSAAFTIVRASGKNLATSLAVGNLVAAMIALVLFQVSPSSLLVGAGLGMPAWVWIVLNGLIAIPLASTLIANGPRFLPSADVSMFFLLETVFTPFWVWLLFAETPSKSVFLGGSIVIATVAAHSYWRLTKTPGSPTPALAGIKR